MGTRLVVFLGRRKGMILVNTVVGSKKEVDTGVAVDIWVSVPVIPVVAVVVLVIL